MSWLVLVLLCVLWAAWLTFGGFWAVAAWLAARGRVFAWLLRRGARNPYTHIVSADGTDTYMFRYWVFNAYGKDAAGEITAPRWPWLPSVRLHRIMRKDQDRDLHDHPWNARTIVLRGYYEEERLYEIGNPLDGYGLRWVDNHDTPREVFRRTQGYTGRLNFGQYHRITEVPADGVWTLFFTWKKRGSWGFLVDGKKVPWREYLKVD